MSKIGSLVFGLAVTAAAGWGAYEGLWRVGTIEVKPWPVAGVSFDQASAARVVRAGVEMVGSVAVFRDELFAYLMLQHYRGSEPLRGVTLWMRYDDAVREEPRYEIVAALGNEEIEAVGRTAWLRERLAGLTVRVVTEDDARRYGGQTRLFDAAYNLPAQRRWEELPAQEKRALMRRFIRFKSTTDPRVRAGVEPLPRTLTAEEAEQLAGDMIAVAEFYELPLEYLLGIGAMENNYMDVRGDLEHSIWKRRAAKDDIVLERRRGRVRVLNYATGVWQITRETLRYAHRLYKRDKRDYGRLPEHLRPPAELNVNEVDAHVLTTYAGLFLRDLLDYFDGDVAKAVGAYNGGPGRPNAKYEEGVRAVAGHAREVLERAAALSGDSVTKRSWISAK